jgi:hypothetical protein
VAESSCPSYPKIETLFNRGPDHCVTDEIRCPEFSQIAHWLVTEKIDGTNIRVSLDCTHDFEDRSGDRWAVRFYGRTDAAQIPTFLLAHLQDTFRLDKMQRLWRGKKDCTLCAGGGWLPVYDPNDKSNTPIEDIRCECVVPYPITLYGEGYGARIQKGGGNYREGVSFRLFDVLVDGRWWLDWENVCDVAVRLGIKVVPEIGKATGDAIAMMVRNGFGSIVAMDDGGDATLGAEGIVARTDPYLFDKRGRPLRFKLKTKDFKENGNG